MNKFPNLNKLNNHEVSVLVSQLYEVEVRPYADNELIIRELIFNKKLFFKLENGYEEDEKGQVSYFYMAQVGRNSHEYRYTLTISHNTSPARALTEAMIMRFVQYVQHPEGI